MTATNHFPQPFPFNPEFSLAENAANLKERMIFESKVHKLPVFHFAFGQGESCSFKSAKTQKFEVAVSEFARFARDEKKQMQIFKNLCGELAVRLV